MVTLAKLKTSISSMTPSDALELVLHIRQLREESKKSTTRKVNKKRAKESRNLESIIDSLTQEQIIELMKELGDG